MATKVNEPKTVKKAKFDLFRMMLLIQSDEKLSRFFSSDYGDDFKMHFLLIKQNLFKKEAIHYVKRMFDSIVLNDESYIDMYNDIKVSVESTEEVAPVKKVVKSEPKVEKKIAVPRPVPTPTHKLEKENQVVKVQFKKDVPVVEPAKEGAPLTEKRRVSKTELEKSIAAKGGMTENERAVLAHFELKNIVARIHHKGKSNKLSDEDARTIIATIDTVKKKLLPILDKK